jgi:hypothetical protein
MANAILAGGTSACTARRHVEDDIANAVKVAFRMKREVPIVEHGQGRSMADRDDRRVRHPREQ